MIRLLDSEAALAFGIEELRRIDPAMSRLLDEGASPPLRKRPPGFPGLVAIVVAQQVSTASAAAILARLTNALPEMSAEAVAASEDEVLLRAGLSRNKLRTVRAISAAIISGELRLDRLGDLPGEDAHAALTLVSGIGPWTADVYLLFCLGHPDIFPAGDLALQEAARLLLALGSRPNAREMAAIAERWRPWRGVAAGVLWAHYRQMKSKEGVIGPA